MDEYIVFFENRQKYDKYVYFYVFHKNITFEYLKHNILDKYISIHKNLYNLDIEYKQDFCCCFSGSDMLILSFHNFIDIFITILWLTK